MSLSFFAMGSFNMVFDSLLNFFISNAYAADPIAIPPAQAPAGGGGNFSLLIIMLGFLLFIYLTVWRPQNKKAQEQREMLGGLKIGDEVVTIGGILGKIIKLNDNYVVLSASDNAEFTVQKSAIANVLPKGTLKAI